MCQRNLPCDKLSAGSERRPGWEHFVYVLSLFTNLEAPTLMTALPPQHHTREAPPSHLHDAQPHLGCIPWQDAHLGLNSSTSTILLPFSSSHPSLFTWMASPSFLVPNLKDPRLGSTSCSPCPPHPRTQSIALYLYRSWSLTLP